MGSSIGTESGGCQCRRRVGTPHRPQPGRGYKGLQLRGGDLEPELTCGTESAPFDSAHLAALWSWAACFQCLCCSEVVWQCLAGPVYSALSGGGRASVNRLD